MKQSDGNSPERLKDTTYFVERPLGKGVGLELRKHGYQVVLHAEVYQNDQIEDDVWIVGAATNGWVALGSDVRLRWTPGLKRAVFLSGLRLFTLTKNHWPGHVKSAAFVSAMPAIEKIVATKPGPFIGTVNKGGDVSGMYDFTGYTP